jgi:hypothetical protein
MVVYTPSVNTNKMFSMVKNLRYLICLFASIYASNGLAQGTTPQTKVARDTIFTLTRDTIAANVTSVSSTKIFYTHPDSSNIEKTIERKVVQRIVYASGKVEQYNKPVFINVATTDWRSIIITDNPADVDGMYLRAVIIGKSASSVTSAVSAKKSAEVMAQKKAANNGGMYILVKNRKELGGYGETPKYYIEGEVYGTSPLPNDQKMRNEVERQEKK